MAICAGNPQQPGERTDSDIAIKVEHVSNITSRLLLQTALTLSYTPYNLKEFCKSLKREMLYGMGDDGRSFKRLGIAGSNGFGKTMLF